MPAPAPAPAASLCLTTQLCLTTRNLRPYPRSCQVQKGELVCVVGRVGSGKSSLVQALLGEMERETGSVAVGGSLAYAAQQAWVSDWVVGACGSGRNSRRG